MAAFPRTRMISVLLPVLDLVLDRGSDLVLDRGSIPAPFPPPIPILSRIQSRIQILRSLPDRFPFRIL